MVNAGELPNLNTLELKMCDLKPEDLVELPKIPRITRVTLDDNKIGSGSGLAPLSKLNSLEFVGLNNVGLSDQGVSYLCNLRTLKSLMLERADLTPAGCKLLSRLPSLSWLSLAFSAKIDDQSIKELAGLRNLEILDLRGCEKVTDKSVPYFCQMKKLTRLDLTGTALTEAGIGKLQKQLPRLRELTYSQQFEEFNQVFGEN